MVQMPCNPRRIVVCRRITSCVCIGFALAFTAAISVQLFAASAPAIKLYTNQNIDWNPYRIGDGIAHYPDSPGCEQFPQSIVCEYHQVTDEPNDVDSLIRVLGSKRWHGYQIDVDQTAFIHVRVGDGLCAENDDDMCRKGRTGVPDCWNHDSDCWFDAGSKTKQYAFSKEWYSKVLEDLDRLTSISVVVILGDKRHWTRSLDPRQGDFTVDEVYLENIASFFRSQHRKTFVMSPGTPDEDFALLCSSRVFVQGGGGYSALVGSVVRVRGGLVLSPKRPRVFIP